MSLIKFCAIGDLFNKIMVHYESRGGVSTELLLELIQKLEEIEVCRETEELKQLLQELQENVGTRIFSALKSFFQTENIASSSLSGSEIRRVKPPIELFVNVLKSYLTRDAIVRRVVKEVGSEIGEQMIDRLKQSDFSVQSLSSSERDLKMFFQSLRNKCENVQQNQHRSYEC